ncbi:zinc finger BED domain-containing protein 6-like isoform X2 [Elysia marginata]|uniref:Zinc finger BED domain-containing protein 6-like isoform X2 n=1 Tax=Elysia marginata TaxID=1093978 RepID=A0AAV4ECN7_9GAST|nr:zinc finger BED domain-containing protein 6-like isoform X2 [Elysia marginata]
MKNIMASDGSEDRAVSTEKQQSTEETHDIFFDFDSLAKTAGRVSSTVTAEIKKSRYFKDAILPRKESPLIYQEDKSGLFPRLSAVARKYLCIAASSVAFER